MHSIFGVFFCALFCLSFNIQCSLCNILFYWQFTQYVKNCFRFSFIFIPTENWISNSRFMLLLLQIAFLCFIYLVAFFLLNRWLVAFEKCLMPLLNQFYISFCRVLALKTGNNFKQTLRKLSVFAAAATATRWHIVQIIR